MIELYKKKGGHVLGEEKKVENHDENKKGKRKDNDSSEDESNSDYDTVEIMEFNKKTKKVDGKDGFEIVPRKEEKKSTKKRKLIAEDLALDSLLIKNKKSRRDSINSTWNRYAFNDGNLPDCFVKDEEKHMKKETPVPMELVDDYKKRVEDINVKPIKKVMEAKARKKKRAMRKLEKAKKKVEASMDSPDVSDREKARQVAALYKKATKEPKKEVMYIVAKKHLSQKRAVRPAGVKGRYKVVDPRIRKDMREGERKNWRQNYEEEESQVSSIG